MNERSASAASSRKLAMTGGSLGFLAVLAGSCMGACGSGVVPVFVAAGGSDAGPGSSTSTGPVPLGTMAEFCQGSGPPALVDNESDGGAVSTCPDALAQRAFRYALCSCNGYVSDHALVTDSFDDSQGAYNPSTATMGGSVGVNGDLHPSGLLQVGGSLWASTATTITTAAVDVAGELHAEGEMRPSPSLFVGADAWLANGIQTMGDVTVKGTLHVPGGAPAIDVSGMQNFGPPVTTPFEVAPACDCAAADLVDVAGVVATYATDNDDTALGIDPAALANVQSDVTMTLGCGRIFLTEIASGQASIHLIVQSRVALFVQRDISTSNLQIDVLSGSELDLFVAGDVTVSGNFQVGDVANPARARTYVGGSVNLGNAATLAGNLYVPNGTVTLGAAASTTLYGSIFASSLSASADLTIHYDQAILTQTSTPTCAAPSTCATCNDCGGQACNGGVCGACSPASPCCAPLFCGPQQTCVAEAPSR